MLGVGCKCMMVVFYFVRMLVIFGVDGLIILIGCVCMMVIFGVEGLIILISCVCMMVVFKGKCWFEVDIVD